MKYPIQEKDLNKDVLYYDVKTNNENYIKWITRGEGGSFEDFPTGLYAENNNNVAATSQENIFTNENQNGDDILAVSGGFKTNDIANECCFQNQNIEPPPQQSTECTVNLSREVNMDEAPEYIKNETYTDDYVRKRIKELKLQEDELEQKKLLFKNEEREILKFLNQSGPPDNMRNKGKSNIGYNNQLLSISHVNNLDYQTKKWDRKMNMHCTTEIRPHFINNKNKKTINISSNRYVNINSYN